MTSLYTSVTDKIPFKSITNKCIVLDLDETLVHSDEKDEKLEYLRDLKLMSDPNILDLRMRTYQITMDDVVYKKGSGIKTVMWGITRPYVKEFLIKCFVYFKVVAVWSAGKRKYVDAIVDYLFKDIKRPHVVYSYDECERTPNGLLVKPLQKMIDNVPGLNKYMNLSNTFIIDDRNTVYKGFQGDNPDNGIQIPAYKPVFSVPAMRSEDIRLKQLMNWFYRPEVIKSTDVRELDKEHIFESNITATPEKIEPHYQIGNINNIYTDDAVTMDRISTLKPIETK